MLVKCSMVQDIVCQRWCLWDQRPKAWFHLLEYLKMFKDVYLSHSRTCNADGKYSLCMVTFPHGDAAAAPKEHLLYQCRLHSMVSLFNTVSQMMSSGLVVAKTCWKSVGYLDCSQCCGIIRFWSPFDVVGFTTFCTLLYMILHWLAQMIFWTADALFSDAFFVRRLVSVLYFARRSLWLLKRSSMESFWQCLRCLAVLFRWMETCSRVGVASLAGGEISCLSFSQVVRCDRRLQSSPRGVSSLWRIL